MSVTSTVDTRLTERAEQIKWIENRLGRALNDYERDLAYDLLRQEDHSVEKVAEEIQREPPRGRLRRPRGR